MGSWRFSVWRSMLSANSDNFISSFLTWMSGISIKTWTFGILWKLGSYLNSVWAGFLWPCAPAGAAPQHLLEHREAQSRSGHPEHRGFSPVRNSSRVPCSRSLLMSAQVMLLLTSPRLAECWLSAGPPLISLSSRRRWGSTPSSHLIVADAVGMGQKGRWGMKTCVLWWSLPYIT